jgi:hypothetical protein
VEIEMKKSLWAALVLSMFASAANAQLAKYPIPPNEVAEPYPADPKLLARGNRAGGGNSTEGDRVGPAAVPPAIVPDKGGSAKYPPSARQILSGLGTRPG